ncbi:MAG: hypothetical protein ACK417_03240 [Bacteroidia bacterium]
MSIKPYALLLFIAFFFQVELSAQSFYWKTAAARFGFQNTAPYSYTLSGNSQRMVESALAPSLSIGPILDFRVYEINSNASVGLYAAPSIGLYLPLSIDYIDNIVDDGVTAYLINAPLYFQFNYGNFSTTKTIMEHGFGLGVGLNYFYMGNPHYRYWEAESSSFEGGGMDGLLFSMRFSYRFWSKSNALKTINIAYSAGPKRVVAGSPFRMQLLEFSFPIFRNY